MFDFKWSDSEKKVARRAYERGLEARHKRFVTEFKERAAAATTPADVWEIEGFLREQRRDIEVVFDYRYSQLPLGFAGMIIRGLIDETALNGLGEEKLKTIREIVHTARRAES